MASQGDLVGRLRARIEAHCPGRVVVLVRHGQTARWIQRLLVEGGVVLGARILDLEGLLSAAARELAGEPLSPVRTLVQVRDALERDPERRFDRILAQPAYQREVLRGFVELERALATLELPAGEPVTVDALADRCPAGSRDRAMVEAFARFREQIAALDRLATRRVWWRGQGLEIVLARHARVAFLHPERTAARVAVDFFAGTTPGWATTLIETLGFERWDGGLSEQLLAAGAGDDRRALSLRLSCAGPEAEIAAVARILRGAGAPVDAGPERRPAPAAVIVPSEAIPRWVARLGHRDVPTRAWVERRAADTAVGRTVRALLRVIDPGRPAVRRVDLEAVLFGPALRAWAALAEDADIDYPRCPHPGDLRDIWAEHRAASFSLATAAARLRAAGERGSEELDERARRFDWPAEQLAKRQRRLELAHRLIAAALDRLEQLKPARANNPAAALGALFDDWGLLARAAIHGVDGPELSAARVVVEVCARLADEAAVVEPGADPRALLAELAASIDHALSFAGAGSWVETRSVDGPPPVWVLPYEAASTLEPLPPRLILTGLDAHPRPPAALGPLSEDLRGELGLVSEATRFSAALRRLDLLTAATGEVVASWRHRDGSGSERPPGPWIAGRQDEGVELSVGVDAIALARPEGAGEPTAPVEDALIRWAEDPGLARRVEAMLAHEAREPGPHTGILDLRVPKRRPYSASALQRYAELPYRYFVERVLGLGDREPEDRDAASALFAREQGKVVHKALEAALAPRLAATTGPVELVSISEQVLADALAALAEGYRKRAEHGQVEAIWASERDRWAAELTIWWTHWVQRVREFWGPKPAGGDSGSSGSFRRPEPDVLIPSSLLIAAEWSPTPAASEGEAEAPSFELDLGPRAIPFSALIDRIEVDPLRQRLNVCDYKTGAPRWPSAIYAELRAGTHLQLPLYALAVDQVTRADPARLGLELPVPVRALRLEYLRRPSRPGSKTKPSLPVARGFDPDAPLGLDDEGRVWTVRAAAARFALAFVEAIEAGRYPVVARSPGRRFFRGKGGRVHELARVVPGLEQRPAQLPAALQPLADPKAAREVVR